MLYSAPRPAYGQPGQVHYSENREHEIAHIQAVAAAVDVLHHLKWYCYAALENFARMAIAIELTIQRKRWSR